MTDSIPSKSARKRAQLELKALGEKLLELEPSRVAELVRDERLLDALNQARRMTAHGALRRQKQLIGKLMRSVDTAPIRAALAADAAEDARRRKQFRLAESWRDRIVAEGSTAIEAFEAATGHDGAALSELSRELQSTFDERREKSLGKQLFRELHRLLSPGS